MKSNDENKIKKMYERIDTPEYDAKDKVLAQIRATKKVPRVNRKVLLVAVLCLVFLLAGTAAAAGVFDHIFTLHLFNDELYNNGPQPTAMPTPIIDTSDMLVTGETNIGPVLLQFVNQAEFGEFRLAHCYDQNGFGHSSEAVSPIVTNDFNEMIKYLEKSSIPLPIPHYIPDGYEFSRGDIDYFMDRSILNIEPNSKWEENGFTYFIYKLPEGFEKNILRYSMFFTDMNDNEIFIGVELCEYDSGMGEIFITDEVTAEYLDVEGFYDSILIQNKHNKNEIGIGLYNAIEPVELVFLSSKVFDDMAQTYGKDSDYILTQDAIFTSITASGLSKRKIIKFAEGLN